MRLRVWLLGLLLLAPALGRAAELRVLVDLPVTASATTASSGAGTELLLWPGVRAGLLARVIGPVVVGGDLTLAGTFATAGTNAASATRLLGGLELRGLAGLSFGGRLAQLVPFVGASALAATGPLFLVGGESSHVRWTATPGARAGGGVLARIWQLHARLDLAAGIQPGRPEVSGAVALGVSF